jgi:hypothetical protein
LAAFGQTLHRLFSATCSTSSGFLYVRAHSAVVNIHRPKPAIVLSCSLPRLVRPPPDSNLAVIHSRSPHFPTFQRVGVLRLLRVPLVLSEKAAGPEKLRSAPFTKQHKPKIPSQILGNRRSSLDIGLSRLSTLLIILQVLTSLIILPDIFRRPPCLRT